MKRPPVSGLLFVFEAFTLVWCVANCFVPGSWRSFWISEGIYYSIATLVTFASAWQKRNEDEAHKLLRKTIFFTPHVVAWFLVTALILIILASHL
jgi:hypothetical protein